jgi:hypothetical protein
MIPVYQRLSFVLALAAIALACQFGDVLQIGGESFLEGCTVVDRAAYEEASAELGQASKTPKYPEHAVYEVWNKENAISDLWHR